MALPQIPIVSADQALSDMLEALALQEAALASLLNAEAAKIDALVAAGMPMPATIQEVEAFQAAVANVVRAVAERQDANLAKLELLRSFMVK
ncbi:MAG: hypothetical protein ACOY94_26025 [Bacillota bacterium]